MSWDILSKANLQYLLTRLKEITNSFVNWKSFGELGVKNVIPYPYHDIPKSVSGIEWTSDVDGCIHIDGTSPSSPVVAVAYLTGGLSGTTGLILSGDYILSLQASTENVTLKMYRQKGSTSYGEYSVITGQSKTITCVDDGESFYILYLQCDGETTFDDDYAYPMLRRAEDTDNTYQPYAMTNRELTLKAMQPNGHIVKNDAGTTLPQKGNLKFGGVYSHNTTDDSVVDIVREFESPSAVEALTGEAAKGFQHTPDTVYRGRTASDIGFDKTGTSFNSTRVQDVLEEVDDRLNSYSTTEKVIGTWIDGKPIYQKTVSCGALPNNSSTTTAHGITGISKIIEITGYAFNGGNTIPLPFINAQNANSKAGVYANKVNIFISTGSIDLSEYSESYVTLKYIKN